MRVACVMAVMFWVTLAIAGASGSRQMVVAIAEDWDATSGRMQLFERVGNKWQASSPSLRVLFGRKGLAWGRGEHPLEPLSPQVPMKRERDGRAPAGVFEIGKIYTYDEKLPEGAVYPFHTITEADAWIDDPYHPDYNRQVRVDLENPPPWFAKQRMRLNDPPHRWLIEIRHNSDPIVAGAGSAIFFHIARGADIPSAGCTVMSLERTVDLVKWLRKSAEPRYVLLPKTEYLAFWKAWGLPPPSVVAALAER